MILVSIAWVHIRSFGRLNFHRHLNLFVLKFFIFFEFGGYKSCSFHVVRLLPSSSLQRLSQLEWRRWVWKVDRSSILHQRAGEITNPGSHHQTSNQLRIIRINTKQMCLNSSWYILYKGVSNKTINGRNLSDLSNQTKMLQQSRKSLKTRKKSRSYQIDDSALLFLSLFQYFFQNIEL